MSNGSACFTEEFDVNQEPCMESSSSVVDDQEFKTESTIIIEEVADIEDTAYIYFDNDNDSSCNLIDNTLSKNKDDTAQDDQQSRVCNVCNKTYKNKGSLATHLRVKHNMTSGHRAKMPCLEPGCDFRGNRIARLITHLIRTHKMKFQCEKVTFKRKEDFWKWKKEAEERCRSSYSAPTASKTVVSGDVKFFLRCRRSGFYKSGSSKLINKRTDVKKGKTSMKINAVCTSFMEVQFKKEGGAIVHFCRTHYGHNDDGAHLRMNTEEREMIRDLILEGFSASKIISIMKTRMPVHRHQLLKYANIRNISVRQNLHMTRGKEIQVRPVDFMKKLPKCVLVRPGEDSTMSIKVENEIEVEANNTDEDSLYKTIILQANSHGSRACSENEEVKQQLRTEIQDKIERISRLAAGLVSDTSLRRLNENLSNIAKSIENEKHIEVIPETNESKNISQQHIVLHRDTDGNLFFVTRIHSNEKSTSGSSFDDDFQS